MPQTVRVEQFWVDRQKMIAYGRLSISSGEWKEWNVEMFAPLGQVQPKIQLPGYYVSLDMVGEDGLRYAGVGLVESIETDRGPNGEARVSILGHGRLWKRMIAPL